MPLTRRAFAVGVGGLALSELALTDERPHRSGLHVPRYAPSLTTNGSTAILSGGAPIGAENKEDHVYSGLLGLVEGIDPATLDQTFLANAVFPRANHASVWVDKQLWLLGGRTRIGGEGRLAFETERIDIGTQAIWRGPDLPTGLINLSAVVVGKSVLVFGGDYRDADAGTSRVSNKVYECAPPYAVWRERAPMPLALGNSGTVVLDKKIYLIGGYDRSVAHAVTQIFDPVSDTWHEGPPPPIPLSAHAAAPHDNRIFCFGDYSSQAKVLGFDAIIGEWRSLDVPFVPRRHVRAVSVGDTIVVAGGNQSSQAPATGVVEAFPASLLHEAFEAAE